MDADAKSKTPGESCVSHRAASLASFLQTAVQAFMRRQVHTSLLFLHFLRESPPESLIRFIKGGFVRLKGDASEWARCRLCQDSSLRLRGRWSAVARCERQRGGFLRSLEQRGKRFDVGVSPRRFFYGSVVKRCSTVLDVQSLSLKSGGEAWRGARMAPLPDEPFRMCYGC